MSLIHTYLATLFFVVIVSRNNVFSANVKSCYVCEGKDCSDEYSAPKTDIVNCTGITLPPFSVLPPGSRSVIDQIVSKLMPRSAADIKVGELGCGKLSVTHPYLNDTVLYIRGCMVQSVMDLDACDYLEHVVGAVLGEVDGCHVCDDNNCNSANSYQISIISLGVVVLFKLFF